MQGGKLKPIYYIYGEEDLLVERELRSIKERALEGGIESFNSHLYYGGSLDAGALLTEALTLPAMSPKRFIVVKQAEAMKADTLNALLDYIEDPMDTTCLVFSAAVKKPDERTRFIKALKKGGYLAGFPLIRQSSVAGFITSELSEAGKTISREALARLMLNSGRRLREISCELERIVLYIGDKGEIEERDVELAGIDVSERTIFDLSDAIGARDLKRALKVLAKVGGEAPFVILGAIARQFRVMLLCKALKGKGLPSAQLARRLGVFDSKVNLYMASAARFSERELKAVFKKLSAADRAFKSSGLPAGLVMSNLIMELCGTPTGRAR